jgi:2,3-dihydroxy-p-cumate/2,3-dihydroxybenzoate 3,4-dioxygenase
MVPFRYLKPGYVALNVTDLDRSVPFYRDLVGLTLQELRDDAAFFRCSDDHHNVVLYRHPAPGIRRMAFQLESAGDLERARGWVAAQGWPIDTVPPAEAAALHQGDTFRFRIPSFSLQFEFYAGIARADAPFVPSVTKIQRLGHVVVGTPQPEPVLATLLERLNFRASDHFGDAVTFLRCFPNPYHHSFGIARSDAERLHHVNFMVSDIDDVGRAMNRLRKHEVPIVYGPGRHDISTSIFLYFLDPDGLTLEYSFGMEEFAEVDPRAPRMLPMKPEILDSWGGLPAPQFAKVGAVDAAQESPR